MVKSVEIAVITAPRKQPTLKKSIHAIRYGGYDGLIHLFNEPGVDPTVMPGVSNHNNHTTLGCFGNYAKALEYMAANSAHKYICVLSDDFIYKLKVFEQLPEMMEQLSNLGYVALYTPQGMRHLMGKKRTWQMINKGWGHAYGGLYVYPTGVAREIISHPDYINHKKHYEANQQIDHIIPQVCYKLGYNQYYHNPSLADHYGKISTIGHKHTQMERGLNFRKN